MNTSNRNRRNALSRLGAAVQPFITWTSGIAGTGEKPLIPISEPLWLFVYMAGLLTSVAATTLLLRNAATWPLVPAGWMLITGFMRAGQTTLLHQLFHKKLLRRFKKLAAALEMMVGVAFLLETLAEYGRKHGLHHPLVAQPGDPDLEEVATYGLVPGAPVEANRRRLFLGSLSPRWHYRKMKARLKATLDFGTRNRKRLLYAYLGAMGALVLAGFGWELLLVWLIPLTVGFNISSKLGLITEHRWAAAETDPVSLTPDRRFLPEPPEAHAHWPVWLAWGARLPAAALARHFIAPYEMTNHSIHHTWELQVFYNHAYEAAAKEAAAPGRSIVTWGFGEALDLVLRDFAALPRTAILGRRDTYFGAEKEPPPTVT